MLKIDQRVLFGDRQRRFRVCGYNPASAQGTRNNPATVNDHVFNETNLFRSLVGPGRFCVDRVDGDGRSSSLVVASIGRAD